MDSHDYVKDSAAIVGIGYSKMSRNSGQTVKALALKACKEAILDAGLRPSDIDGIVTYQINDSVSTADVAEGLGIPKLSWFDDRLGGGHVAVSVVAEAAMVVATGDAKSVLVYRAMNGRSGFRYGQFGVVTEAHDGSQFTAPYGYVSPPQWVAMWCRRYMHEYGLRQEQLGEIAITCRRHAALNERAVMRTPITMEDYLDARWVAEPFRIYDCCTEVDGACAIVVTSADRARDLRHRPVYIAGSATGVGPRPHWVEWDAGFSTMYGKYVSTNLWKRTGYSPKDMDFAEIYDCFTYSLLCQLEDFGFCKKGEGGSFVEGGRISLGGELPINTHGGLLSEGYLHGFNHTPEAVSQLRGDAGARQVPNAHVCLVTGGAGPYGAGIIYHN